jgi:hypothetical protein
LRSSAIFLTSIPTAANHEYVYETAIWLC